jgi:hypothetical protein
MASAGAPNTYDADRHVLTATQLSGTIDAVTKSWAEAGGWNTGGDSDG